MEKIYNTVFPEKCIFCNKLGSSFCYKCLHECQILNKGHCVVCDDISLFGVTHYSCLKPGIPLACFSPFIYDGFVRECIKRSKFGPMLFASLKHLTYEGLAFSSKVGFVVNKDVELVPIPLSKKRSKERGFNQSLIIANICSKSWECKVSDKLLYRVKPTALQADLSRKNRKLNLAGAFRAKGNTYNKKLLLIDDITTTGVTFLEAAKVLYAAGAEQVSCFALSKKL